MSDLFWFFYWWNDKINKNYQCWSDCISRGPLYLARTVSEDERLIQQWNSRYIIGYFAQCLQCHIICNVMFAQCIKVLLCMNNVSLRQPRLIQLSVSSVNQWYFKQADIFPVSLSARIRYMYWSMLISRYLLTISPMS